MEAEFTLVLTNYLGEDGTIYRRRSQSTDFHTFATEIGTL